GELRRQGRPVSAARLRALHHRVWSATAFPDERRAPAFMRNGAAELEAYRARGGFDAVPAYLEHPFSVAVDGWTLRGVIDRIDTTGEGWRIIDRSEEHTSELQSRFDLVCRLLLEKKKI